MTRILAPVGALLLSVTILLAGNGLQTTLLPVRAEMEVFSSFAIASVLVSLAAIPVALTTSAAPAPLSEVRLRPLHLLDSRHVA